MKTIIKIFAAVLAVTPVLVSCYSEPLPEVIPEVIPEDEDNGSEQDTTARVITVSFDTKATRTVLGSDGFTPEFSAGDEIYVANGTGFETPEVEYKNIGGKDVATISVSLGGPLKLVYPSNCAKLGHYNEEDDTWAQNPNEIAGIIVPPEQTGYFKDANICMAEMKAGDTKATFHNETAVFVIDVPADTKYLEVTSLRTINSDTGQRYTGIDGDDEWATISRVWNGKDWYSARRNITIGDGKIKIPDPCFVSIMVEEGGEVLLRDLNFDAQYRFDSSYDGLAGTMGGFSSYFLKETFKTGSADSTKVHKGAIYSGVEDHLHDYVNVGYLSYSTEDLGLAGNDTSETGYYAWGEKTGHRWNDTAFETTSGTSGYAFSWGNSPFKNEEPDLTVLDEKCCEIIGTNGKKSYTLPLAYDAAYYNWGGAWRMPRYSDEVGLQYFDFSTDYTTYTYTATSRQGRGTLVFTRAGYGDGESRKFPTGTSGDAATYWTASWDADNDTGKAYVVTVKSSVGISAAKNQLFSSRYMGHAIRPVVGPEHDRLN